MHDTAITVCLDSFYPKTTKIISTFVGVCSFSINKDQVVKIKRSRSQGIKYVYSHHTIITIIETKELGRGSSHDSCFWLGVKSVHYNQLALEP